MCHVLCHVVFYHQPTFPHAPPTCPPTHLLRDIVVQRIVFKSQVELVVLHDIHLPGPALLVLRPSRVQRNVQVLLVPVAQTPAVGVNLRGGGHCGERL